jgi:hypothetical protein
MLEALKDIIKTAQECPEALSVEGLGIIIIKARQAIARAEGADTTDEKEKETSDAYIRHITGTEI